MLFKNKSNIHNYLTYHFCFTMNFNLHNIYFDIYIIHKSNLQIFLNFKINPDVFFLKRHFLKNTHALCTKRWKGTIPFLWTVTVHLYIFLLYLHFFILYFAILITLVSYSLPLYFVIALWFLSSLHLEVSLSGRSSVHQVHQFRFLYVLVSPVYIDRFWNYLAQVMFMWRRCVQTRHRLIY